MKKWSNPEVEVLGVKETLHGTSYNTRYDDVRVDSDGNYWYSYSGPTVEPSTKPGPYDQN